jgi:hypothetical protein
MRGICLLYLGGGGKRKDAQLMLLKCLEMENLTEELIVINKMAYRKL